MARVVLSPSRRFTLGAGRVTCAVVVFLWAASFRWSAWYEQPGQKTLVIGRGFVRYGGMSRAAWGIPPPPGLRIEGAAIWHGSWIPWVDPSCIHIPFWCVLVAAGAIMARARFHDPAALTAGDECRGCGYNLAGLSRGAGCPECGRGVVAG